MVNTCNARDSDTLAVREERAMGVSGRSRGRESG